MTTQEILEAHQQVPGHYDCRCGWEREAFTGYVSHRAHVAEVLDKHMQEREAKAWDEGVGDSESLMCMTPPCGSCKNCDTPLINPYK